MRPQLQRLASSLALFSIGFTSTLWVKATQAQVPPTGTFTATEACPAQQRISGLNPGNVQLTVGERYQAVGFNSPRREFVMLKVPGASPDRRWVRATCGEFQAAEGSDAPTDPTPGKPRQLTLLPFFDTEDNPVPVENDTQPRDISPKPPTLEPFDKKILALCNGEFDAPVDPKQFRQLIAYYPDVLRKLKQATGGELKPNRRSDEEFLDDLTAIWFGQRGFKHIFCGEKDGRSIGGLHFYGRYIEFQEAGTAGRILKTSDGKDAREEVVDGEIYSFGVAIKQGDRIIAEHQIKGYPYVSNAQEMLIDATRAFKLFKLPKNAPEKESIACLYTISDPQAKQPFLAVFVKKAGAIRTYYPDATPDFSRTQGRCEEQ